MEFLRAFAQFLKPALRMGGRAAFKGLKLLCKFGFKGLKFTTKLGWKITKHYVKKRLHRHKMLKRLFKLQKKCPHRKWKSVGRARKGVRQEVCTRCGLLRIRKLNQTWCSHRWKLNRRYRNKKVLICKKCDKQKVVL